MTNEINPNRGGPTAYAPDPLSPRFNHRGRADSNSVGTFKDRLRDQVEHGEAINQWWPTAETLDDMARHCEDNIRGLMRSGLVGKWYGPGPDPIIQPSQELGRAWMEDLGGEE